MTADPAAQPRAARRLRREAWGFAVGSLCFFVGILPVYVDAVGTVAANITFVIGSVFFTLAAFIQLRLSGRRLPHPAMNPADRADWWAAAVQFAGTLLFNVSTAAALVASIARPDVVGAGWRPDAWGSLAFLVASAFALIATSRRGDLWDLDARTWHGTWLNAFGAVAFAVSAVGAYVVPGSGALLSPLWSSLGTGIGAACFFLAAILSRREIPAH